MLFLRQFLGEPILQVRVGDEIQPLTIERVGDGDLSRSRADVDGLDDRHCVGKRLGRTFEGDVGD